MTPRRSVHPIRHAGVSARPAPVPRAAVALPPPATAALLTPRDRCPDCERPTTDRWCPECGREIDGRPSTLADRTQRHLRRLTDLGIETKRHGAACITRATGGWARPAHDPGTLRQTCPCCGRDEYRGAFCSNCGIPTGAADWHRPKRSEEQQAVTAASPLMRQKAAGRGENGPSRSEAAQSDYAPLPPEQLLLPTVTA
jgi:hypothetical protein